MVTQERNVIGFKKEWYYSWYYKDFVTTFWKNPKITFIFIFSYFNFHIHRFNQNFLKAWEPSERE